MVPVLEFCTTLLATTVELKVVVPVLVKEMLPSPCAPPTAPVKVMLPEPVVIFKSNVLVAVLFSVLLKLITPLLEELLLLNVKLFV
ncbi:hypothetical protein PHIN7_13370 [Polynucleobacter sp. HIN7]|nr:hypothetical protein PHIN7_13370 [Polynucleobacter sp. HIN7]